MISSNGKSVLISIVSLMSQLNVIKAVDTAEAFFPRVYCLSLADAMQTSTFYSTPSLLSCVTSCLSNSTNCAAAMYRETSFSRECSSVADIRELATYQQLGCQGDYQEARVFQKIPVRILFLIPFD